MPEWDPVEVQPSRRKQYVAPDGRKFWDSELTISVRQAEMLHQGYMCARCMEDVTALGAFPERCPLCQFQIGRYQRQMLEEQYQGVDPFAIPAGFPLEREREHLERAAYRPKGLVTMSLPKSKRRPK